jgi:hypothetical protein
VTQAHNMITELDYSTGTTVVPSSKYRKIVLASSTSTCAAFS